jgi:uncharacterized protein (TIGR02271 family)
VHTGLFGTNESFVPIADAELNGNDLAVPFSKDQIKGAPNVDPAGGHLSEQEEEELYRYYGLARGDVRSDAGTYDTGTTGTGTYDTAAGTAAGTAVAGEGTYAESAAGGAGYADTSVGGVRDDASAEYATGTTAGDYASTTAGDATVGRDVSGPTTDSAVTRSEEQLNVGTERVEAGRARLRKWVETETQTVDVPVTKERARLVTEPITDENRDAAYDGPAISEEEHEVTLHEERPVVTTEAVPVERVRLETEAETQQQQVSGEVRKERIDLDDNATVTSDRDRL